MAGRPSKPQRHGSVNTYKNKGCRCLLCKDAWRHYNRKYVRKHREGLRLVAQYLDEQRDKIRAIENRQEAYDGKS